MGVLIKREKTDISSYFRQNIPIILCSHSPKDDQTIEAAGYQQCRLNQCLAAVLSKQPGSDRSRRVRDSVFVCLPSDTAIYLTDYEMLFDPRFEINVLRLFVEIGRYTKLIVAWCGSLSGSTLSYAEPVYPEYKQYRIEEYNLICIY